MDDIELAIRVAWQRIAPQLAADRFELDRRLARRAKLKLFDHPPRAWCLALRASDTRLPSRMSRCPERAQRVEGRHSIIEDRITLTRSHLHKLCSPIHLDKPGETLASLSRKLGVTRSAILTARLAGVFTERRIRGLAGHGGKPRPILYSPLPLDPASRNFAPPDPIWSYTASHLTNHLPADLEPFTLWRVPVFGPRIGAPGDDEYGDDVDDLHPENPRRDGVANKRKSRALPPRPPAADDYVWYKQDRVTGAYLGYDRNNKLAAANHFRKQRQLALTREAQRTRRRERGRGQQLMKGSLVFRGWQWICPRCERRANLLYMPAGRKLLVAGCELRVEEEGSPASALATNNSQLATSPEFACDRCLRPRRFTYTNLTNTWNEIIAYLTDGLLFGREVKHPIWLIPARKIPYTPRPNRDPSQRRPQIEAMLLSGLTFQQIATALGLAKGTVLWTAQQIYKQHGVSTLIELKKKHGQEVEDRPALLAEVRRRIQAGQPVPQITEALGVPTMVVYNQRQTMRKRGVKLKDGRKGNRVRWEPLRHR